jgi:RNA polymerase Rpb5, N-terminal domain
MLHLSCTIRSCFIRVVTGWQRQHSGRYRACSLPGIVDTAKGAGGTVHEGCAAAQIFVFFAEDAKVGVKSIKTYAERMRNETVSRAVMVVQVQRPASMLQAGICMVCADMTPFVCTDDPWLLAWLCQACTYELAIQVDRQRASAPSLSRVHIRQSLTTGHRPSVPVDAQVQLTAFAKQCLAEMAPKYVIEVFQEAELLVNITQHVLVPKHQVGTLSAAHGEGQHAANRH